MYKNLFIKYLRYPIQQIIKDAKTGEVEMYTFHHPVGMVIAQSPSNIGWSLCAVNDHFSYKLARTIAMGRLAKHPKKLPPQEMILFITDTMPEIEHWYADQLARDA
jgi:hypothetical protein